MARRQHWNTIYSQKGGREVSWFEALPEISLRMLGDAGLTPESCVIDVGGGDSRLVDALTAKGLDCVAVLDVAADWSLKAMDIWHDRAVFHFLIDSSDRARYVGNMREVLKIGGSAIERREHVRFAFETLQPVRVARHARRQDFDGDITM